MAWQKIIKLVVTNCVPNYYIKVLYEVVLLNMLRTIIISNCVKILMEDQNQHFVVFLIYDLHAKIKYLAK